MAPVYFVHGDEPLQREESADLIRRQVMAQGEVEREIFHVARDFDWDTLATLGSEMSLFAETRLVELKLGATRVPAAGTKAFIAYTEQLPEGVTLLVTADRLDANQRKSRWCKALASAGVETVCWPIKGAMLGRWLEARLASVGLGADPDVVQLLLQRVEGNLLAARQEIERLRLLHGEGRITMDRVASGVGDSARYDVFSLVDAALQGDVARVCRIIDRLRDEGVEPTLILWALSREAQRLSLLSHGSVRGEPLDRMMYSERVPKPAQAGVRKALSARGLRYWQRVVQRCAEVDRVLKGRRHGDVWDGLLGIGLSMARSPVC